MTILTELLPAGAGHPVPSLDPRRLAVAAHLARYRGDSRAHVESDLRAFLAWCGDRDLDPLTVQRPQLELYATRRLRHLAATCALRLPRLHPHMLRHTFVTTMLDAGVDLRDVQIAARHADPRTTMRYDRARKNLDRHPNYILAAFMASGA